MRSLLVKLPNWMGDILFAYDLLQTLSNHFERMAFLTSTQHAEIFETFPFRNAEVIDYAPENWPYLDRDTVLRIEKFQPDAGLLLPNSIGSALSLWYSGVPRLYGYATEHRGFLLEKSLPPPEHKLHQTEYYLRLAQLFDLTPAVYPPEQSPTRNGTVVLHPGASKPERAWHVERYLKIAEVLSKKGWKVMFVSGEPIATYPYMSLIKPSLKDFSALLRSCSLFIGNDSGPLHLAQQCGAPVIGIYGPGDPIVTGPRSITKSRVVYRGFPCSPCRQNFFEECDPAPTKKPFCIETISTEEVIKAVAEMLEVK